MAEVRALFRAILREGRKFPNYNVREYVKRRAREGFHEAAGLSDPPAVAALVKKAREELDVVKRQSIVYSLYTRKVKNVLEIDMAHDNQQRLGSSA